MSGTPLFVPAGPRGIKVRCRVCGATGYDDYGGAGHSWMAPHRRGHSPCLRCGKPLSLLKNGAPRRHLRCPLRATEDAA